MSRSSTTGSVCTRPWATAPRPRRGPAWKGSTCARPRDVLIPPLHSSGAVHFLEQQVATEQAEFVAEFFWALHAKGCEAPGRMAEWIDSHNALVGRLLGQLDRRNAPLGPRHK